MTPKPPKDRETDIDDDDDDDEEAEKQVVPSEKSVIGKKKISDAGPLPVKPTFKVPRQAERRPTQKPPAQRHVEKEEEIPSVEGEGVLQAAAVESVSTRRAEPGKPGIDDVEASQAQRTARQVLEVVLPSPDLNSNTPHSTVDREQPVSSGKGSELRNVSSDGLFRATQSPADRKSVRNIAPTEIDPVRSMRRSRGLKRPMYPCHQLDLCDGKPRHPPRSQ